MAPASLSRVLLVLLPPAAVLQKAAAARVWEAAPAMTDPTGDNKAKFRGGHAHNQIVDSAACEFKKSHDGGHMDRYRAEVDFLRTASRDPLWSRLVPEYIREESHDGRPFFVMRSLTCGFENPIIADFKLGTQSWKPDFRGRPGADAAKRAKMEVLDSASTTKSLGVRITSVQLPPPDAASWVNASVRAGAEYQLGGRVAVKKGLAEGEDAWKGGTTIESFSRLLEAYLPTPALRARFVQELQPFLETFSVQKTYRFTGASLFVFYDGEGAGSPNPKLHMGMIDFPHTLGSPDEEYGELDTGVLKGLMSLRDAVIALGAGD